MTSSGATEQKEDRGGGSRSTESFLSGTLHHVSLDKIEKELIQLWKQADKSGADGDGSVTRACSFNLILFSTDSGAELNAGQLLDDIMLSHPCRAILALALPFENGESKESLDAWVTARCHLAAGGKGQQICCEQITVRYEGEGTLPLASVVLPLTIGDLPTFFWWQPQEVVLADLEPFLHRIDRILFDSGTIGVDLTKDLEVVGTLVSELPEGVAVHDLNWRRILPWRQAVARSFERCRSHLDVEDLDLISEVRIHVVKNDADGDRSQYAQGLILAGWLASRLDWSPVSAEMDAEGSLAFELKQGRRKIALSLRVHSAEEGSAGSILGVNLSFLNRKDEGLVICRQHGAPGLRTGMEPCNDVPEGAWRLKELGDSELVVDILDDAADRLEDKLYRDALAKAASLASMVKS